MNETLKNFKQVNASTEAPTVQTVSELKRNKKELEKLYSNYLKKSEELRKILGDYQNCRRNSGLQLRRIQMWLKVSYPKLLSSFKKRIKKPIVKEIV